MASADVNQCLLRSISELYSCRRFLRAYGRKSRVELPEFVTSEEPSTLTQGVSLFYNISSNFFDNANAASIAAAANYLGEDKANFATKFKSADTTYNALLTAGIILSPLSLVIDSRGIFEFSMAPLLIIFISTFVTLVFYTINFPMTGNDCMWPFNMFEFTKRYPYYECVFSTSIQILIKVSKYAFYDIVKEAVSMKIEPELRPLFKGVFDGSMAKFGKCVGSIYGIIMGGLFSSSDNRYYFPITSIILMGFCFYWFLAITYLSKSYDEAKASKTYMNPDMLEKLKVNL